jgi:outer membrane protein with beta-barrel domain
MHATPVAVCCAVALSSLPLATHAQAPPPRRVGIGVTVPDVGLFVPINFSARFRLEPYVNFQSTRADYETTSGSDSVWSSFTQIGLGIFSVMHPEERLSLYVGPRAGLLRASRRQNGTGGEADAKDSGWFIAGAVGGEYSPAPHFSVGGEARIEYNHASSTSSGAFSMPPNLYARSVFSSGALFLRFYP